MDEFETISFGRNDRILELLLNKIMGVKQWTDTKYSLLGTDLSLSRVDARLARGQASRLVRPLMGGNSHTLYELAILLTKRNGSRPRI